MKLTENRLKEIIQEELAADERLMIESQEPPEPEQRELIDSASELAEEINSTVNDISSTYGAAIELDIQQRLAGIATLADEIIDKLADLTGAVTSEPKASERTRIPAEGPQSEWPME